MFGEDVTPELPMGRDASRHQIVVVPVNGYANRLQAMASANYLAKALDWSMKVCWLPEPGCAAPAEVIFSKEVVESIMISGTRFESDFGLPPTEVPLWLTKRGPVVFLRGHSRGEQAFMHEFEQALEPAAGIRRIVIVAGGRFCLNAQENQRQSPLPNPFLLSRRAFYQSITWSPPICSLLQEYKVRLGSAYLGVHIRATDRSIDRPTDRGLRKALHAARDSTGLELAYLAADSRAGKDHWREVLLGMGMEVISQDSSAGERSEANPAVEALVDFLLLANSLGIVYTPESSFGHEACVMSGRYPSYPVSAPHYLRTFRSGTSRATRLVRKFRT